MQIKDSVSNYIGIYYAVRSQLNFTNTVRIKYCTDWQITFRNESQIYKDFLHLPSICSNTILCFQVR